MNSETPKHGGSGGGELEKRVTGVETRLTVIEKTMVTAEVFQRELGALRDELRLAFARVRDEGGALRNEMQVGFAEMRNELHVGFAEVRREMQVGFAQVRNEMQAQDRAVRAEIAGLRDEMRSGFGEVRTEMQALDGALRVEIAKTPFETFKWLLAAAGLAAAIATAIYNIWFR